MTKPIDRLGIDRVRERGTGVVVERRESALLVRDTVSEAFLLDCDDVALGLEVLDGHAGEGIDLLMVTNVHVGRAAFERYGFADKLECYQVAYYGEPPTLANDARIVVRTANEDDLPLLVSTYDLICWMWRDA